jgi:iron complex transport system substrate-binding protein
MRIISFEPYLTALVASLDKAGELVGISSRCSLFEEAKQAVRIGVPLELAGASPPRNRLLERRLSRESVTLEALLAAKPDAVLTAMPDIATEEDLPVLASQALSDLLGKKVKVRHYAPQSLREIFQMIENVGKVIEAAERGRDIAQRWESQFQDWARNFYTRTKNKRVTLLSSIEPFILPGLWVPDMIRLCSATSHAPIGSPATVHVDWQDLVDFKPDVIIVALEGEGLQGALKSFRTLEKLPFWEELPAVKRGEVIFTDGSRYFHSPGPGIVTSMGILVSAIGGLESGYITERGSFHRLRWVEINRQEWIK